MRPFLIVLTILIFAADAAVFVRFRKWLAQLERHPDKPLTEHQERTLQNVLKLIGILSAAWTLLTLVIIFL